MNDYEASLYVVLLATRQYPHNIDVANLEHLQVIAGHTATRLQRLMFEKQKSKEHLPKPIPFKPGKNIGKVYLKEV